MKRVRLVYHLMSGWNDVFEFPSTADLYRFLIHEKDYLYEQSNVQSVKVSISEVSNRHESDLFSVSYDLDYSGITFDDFCALVYSVYEVSRDE